MEGDPNALGYLALFMFVPFGVALFFVMRPPAAATAVFLIAYMFLPELVSLKIPGVPQFGKTEVAAVAVLIGCLIKARRK
ncbi:MAG TPA: hypothetical protein VGO62_09500, partial [Myxococcota bacterium]